MKRLMRKIHRWLGLLMAVQIIAWMASGLWFALFPIAEIRGEHLTRVPEALGLETASGSTIELASPSELPAVLERHLPAGWGLDTVQLVRYRGDLAWRVEGSIGQQPFRRLVRGDASGVIGALDREGAEAHAQAWLLQPGKVAGVDWVEQAEADSEIRGRPLPLWRVRYDEPEGLSLYLDPWTGDIAARRTDRWRIFDFLWMLHIMDYGTRDDFNTPLLQIAAALGLVIALSGLLLWVMTTRARRRRRPASA